MCKAPWQRSDVRTLSSTWLLPPAGLHHGFKRRGGFIRGEGEPRQPEREHPDRPKRDSDTEQHGSESWKEGFESSSAPRTPQTVEQHRAPSLQSEEDEEEEEEEEGSNLIRPQKPLSPLKASKSHRELHKELRMTHTRKVLREEKSELQRALEKRRWEQRIKASRDQDEETKKRSPLYQELTKRHQRLEMLEGERRQQQEGPEFLRVRERLRKIPVLDLGE
ncbi:actin-associated protein FAM107A isoform X1 [Takifugu flavidus]|uniref:actin-associated protein FAM107A isoform X1 n=1 Tax=Takifugu flavidus TaxID=433684 RepID=UPI002544B4D2|nr:actin-associated protein FAM107A isoform X1 [Takifugu flavidus]